jgi:hypothetical protein
MAISLPKAITRLFSEVVTNGIVVPENEKVETITALCEKKGQFIFYVDSYWSFVKTKFNDIDCIRMVFALKENSGGKVHNIDRVVELIKNVERTLIYVDCIRVMKKTDFIYLDVIKYT